MDQHVEELCLVAQVDQILAVAVAHTVVQAEMDVMEMKRMMNDNDK